MHRAGQGRACADEQFAAAVDRRGDIARIERAGIDDPAAVHCRDEPPLRSEARRRADRPAAVDREGRHVRGLDLDPQPVGVRAIAVAGIDLQRALAVHVESREARASLDDRDPLDRAGHDGDAAAAAKLDRVEMRQRDELGRESRGGGRKGEGEQGKDRVSHGEPFSWSALHL
jgi:hypothetical protein